MTNTCYVTRAHFRYYLHASWRKESAASNYGTVLWKWTGDEAQLAGEAETPKRTSGGKEAVNLLFG